MIEVGRERVVCGEEGEQRRALAKRRYSFRRCRTCASHREEVGREREGELEEERARENAQDGGRGRGGRYSREPPPTWLPYLQKNEKI